MEQRELVKRWNSGDGSLSYEDMLLAEESRFKKKLVGLPILICDFCRVVNKQIIELRLDNYGPTDNWKCPHCGSRYQVKEAGG